MNDIQIFNNPEFGEIRTVMIDDEPWFVGNDCANALGYEKPRNAVVTHVDKDDTLKRGVMDSIGRMQDMTVINESGLYSLIFGSKLESAKKFKRWVTSEVLPTLRKTGSYGQPKLPENPMELLELHYEAIKHVDKKVDAVQADVESVKADLDKFKQDMPILGVEENNITNAVKSKGVHLLGGKSSSAYADKSLRSKLYMDMYRELKRNFGVSTYKAIKRNQCSVALDIIDKYIPPLILLQQIDSANAQMRLEVD